MDPIKEKRTPKNERIAVRIPEGFTAIINSLLKPDEGMSDFAREAVEKELRKRERKMK